MGNIRILIIDDEANLKKCKEMIRILEEEYNACCEKALTLEEAKAKYVSEEWDAIILDKFFPIVSGGTNESSGKKFIEFVEQDEKRQIPILIHSTLIETPPEGKHIFEKEMFPGQFYILRDFLKFVVEKQKE